MGLGGVFSARTPPGEANWVFHPPGNLEKQLQEAWLGSCPGAHPCHPVASQSVWGQAVKGQLREGFLSLRGQGNKLYSLHFTENEGAEAFSEGMGLVRQGARP